MINPAIWLAAGILLMALEILVPGFVIFWFGIGAVLTSVTAFTGILENPVPQTLFFLISSVSLLGAWFGFLKKKFDTSPDDARDPSLARLRGRCTKAIGPNLVGEVELGEHYHGLKVWAADSAEQIAAGEDVIVEEASGIKLVVKKAPPPEPAK